MSRRVISLLSVTWLLLLAACTSERDSSGKPAEPAGNPEQAVSEENEPAHKLVLENAQARVFKVELPPGKSMLLHRHDHDYVSIVLNGTELETQVVGKKPVRSRRSSGDVRYIKGGFAHRTTNTGDAIFRNIIVDILKARGPQTEPPPQRSLDLGHGHLEDVVVDNSQVRVVDVQIAPGARTDENTHASDHLVVSLSDYELEHTVKGSKPAIVQHKAGEILRATAGTHILRNTGRQQAHYVAVEFK